jgi:L-threonylcarbamoyladenylate synthase
VARVVGENQLDQAIAALASGGVVAVPTDTVYGLAAPLTEPGVRALFDLKGRPEQMALPVLVAGIDQAKTLVSRWPQSAATLAGVFWPGPLTLVVPARSEVGELVGGSGDSVGIRWPAHLVLDTLCRTLGPLAVTSANRHGGPPAMTAEEVVVALRDSASLSIVVDGGLCDGRPSTVVDCVGDSARELRSGDVAWAEVARALGD